MGFKIVIKDEEDGSVHLATEGKCFEVIGALVWALKYVTDGKITKDNKECEDYRDAAED